MRSGSKIEFARQLRGSLTDAETRLWFHLRRRQLAGFRFRRQHPVAQYVADFVCLETMLIVELDGSQHLDSATDPARDAFLRSSGFCVLRFWNHDVLKRADEVLSEILRALTSDSE